MKRKITRLLRRVTTSVSSSKFTKGVKLWKKANQRPRVSFPRNHEEAKGMLPELYSRLSKLVNKFIEVEDALHAYEIKYPGKRDSSWIRLDGFKFAAETDLKSFWKQLDKLEVLPWDCPNGLHWRTWTRFVKCVRNDSALLNRITPRIKNDAAAA